MTAEPTKAHLKPTKYILIFFVLAAVTAIEFVISGFITEETRTLITVALIVLSILKAALVMSFFMHLKYDSRAYTLLMLFPLFMAILLAAVVLVAAAGA